MTSLSAVELYRNTEVAVSCAVLSPSFLLLTLCRSPRKGLMSPRLKAPPTKQVFGFLLPPGSVTSLTPVVSALHPLQSRLSQIPVQATSDKGQQSDSSSSSRTSDEDSSTKSVHSRGEVVGSHGNDRTCCKGSPHSVSPPIDVKFQHSSNRRTPPTQNDRPGYLQFT